MENGKEAESGAETSAKSPTEGNFQERFNEKLKIWRDEGCNVQIEGPVGTLCRAKPHRTKMTPKDSEGNVTMVIDCEAGHPGVWEFKVAEVELQEELKRTAEAAKQAEANGGKTMDPMIARVSISLDLRTQEVKIEPWVPTPGMGLQLAAMLTAHFTAQFNSATKQSGPRLLTPGKGIVHPKTGKLLTQ